MASREELLERNKVLREKLAANERELRDDAHEAKQRERAEIIRTGRRISRALWDELQIYGKEATEYWKHGGKVD